MPAMGNRYLTAEEGDAESVDAYFSSFDMIAHMLNVAAKHGGSVQAQRMHTQRQAEEALFNGIDALSEEVSCLHTFAVWEPCTDHALQRIDQKQDLVAHKIWPLFCAYKRKYVSGFINNDNPDFRFDRYEHVDKKSPIWSAALDHAKGHDELFGVPAELGCKLLGSAEPTYAELIVRTAKRIWLAGRAEQALPSPVELYK